MEKTQQNQFGVQTMLLATTGLVAPIVFTAMVVLQGLLQPDYSHISLPISALSTWPSGWLQNVNFVISGSLIVAFSVGLHRGIRPSRNGSVGPALLIASGIGLLIAAAFPWQRAGSDFVVPAGHLIGAALTFLGAGVGLITISRRMARDRRWRSLATYVLMSGIIIVLLLLLTMILARPEDAPLHQWLGLLQRITLAVWFPCIAVLAFRLWRVAPLGPTEAEGLPSGCS